MLERPQGLGVAVSVSLERGKRCRSLVAIAKVHHRRKVVAKALCAEKVALMLESSLSCWSFAEITWPYKNLAKEPIWIGPCLSGLLQRTPSQPFPHHKVDAKVPPLLSRSEVGALLL